MDEITVPSYGRSADIIYLLPTCQTLIPTKSKKKKNLPTMAEVVTVYKYIID